MRQFCRVVSTAALFAVLVGGVAHAEDFTFTVPLRLNNLHSQVESVILTCGALDAGGGQVGSLRRSYQLVTPGSFTQDVVMAFNTAANREATDAVRYECDFELMIKGDNFPGAPGYNSVGAYKAKAGTPLVVKVGGPIPKLNPNVMSVPKSSPKPLPVRLAPRR